MPKKTHYSAEDDFNTGYGFGTVAGASGEELDYSEQDAAAREIYETIEGHEPDCECDFCRLIGDYDTFSDGYSAGYTTEYDKRHR
jgi:hypothetical protein